MVNELQAFEIAMQPVAGMAAIAYRAFRAQRLSRPLCYLLTVILLAHALGMTKQQPIVPLGPLPRIGFREAA